MKQHPNPCSGPTLVYQDLSKCHDWPVKNTIVHLPVKIKEIWNALPVIRWVHLGPRTRISALPHRRHRPRLNYSCDAGYKYKSQATPRWLCYFTNVRYDQQELLSIKTTKIDKAAAKYLATFENGYINKQSSFYLVIFLSLETSITLSTVKPVFNEQRWALVGVFFNNRSILPLVHLQKIWEETFTLKQPDPFVRLIHSDEDKLSILKIICHVDMRLSCVKVAKYSLHLAEISWFLANFARSIIQGSDNTWPRLVCIAIISAWVLCQNWKNSIFFLSFSALFPTFTTH